MSTLELEPRRTALVLIDLMPRVIALDTAPLSGREVLERCVALAQATRSVGGLVVHVRVERPGVDVQPEGSELAAELDPQPADVEIVKRTVGAFHQTGLDQVLRERDVDTVVLGGIATNFGVESTGRAADEHGYKDHLHHGCHDRSGRTGARLRRELHLPALRHDLHRHGVHRRAEPHRPEALTGH